jgi:3-oxoacid CoA-transferase subunit A
MFISKIYASFREAVADIPDGAVIMIGGFGVAGDLPQNLILALRNHGAKGLTIITNSAGVGSKLASRFWGMTDFVDPNTLIENKQVKKFIMSISFPDTIFEKANLSGEVDVEWIPQGTLAERIRAGGFGIGGFYTPTGVGTLVEEGKEKRIIDGKEYLLEMPLRADYALIRAYKADKFGNLVYQGNTRSFNAVMAPAAKTVIAEVDEIVEVGELDPEVIITPQIFVHRIVKIPKERRK